MGMGWTIGTFFKIPVRLHFTMLLLPLLTFSWMPIKGPAGVLAWLALIVRLFGSVLLHELGHALTARRYGVRTLDIVLTPIGGMARVIDLPRKPAHEIAIALAGPVVSLILAGSAFALSIPLLVAPFIPEVFLHGLSLLIWINLMLGLFNLIPALPMDGGRVLRGYLALKRNYLEATRIAVKVGRGLAVAGAVAAIFWLNSWNLALISGFVYIAAGGELRMAEMRALRERAAKEQWNPHAGPGAKTWSWTWESRDPYGQTRPRPTDDWVAPSSENKNDVIVITNGKAEIISRKDPEDE
jgi:Zn-dependent protease